MEVHNILKPFNLLLFLLLLPPCHLAQQPKVSPSPSPDSSESSPLPSLSPSQSSRAELRQSPSSGPAPGPSSDSYEDDEADVQEYDVSIALFASTDAESPSDSIEFDFSPTLAPSADVVNPEVKKICESTDYPHICLAAVAPFLNGETDVPSILDIAIQAGSQFTKYGQITAKKLARNPENSPQLTDVLNQCSDSFGKAMDNFAKATEAIPEHDKSTLNTMLSAIVAFVADCRDANSQDAELYSISDMLVNMTINCLAISSLMD